MVELQGRAGHPFGKLGHFGRIAAPEAAHAVAELVVPFHERRREGAQLVAARADIPGLGDQLDLGQSTGSCRIASKKAAPRSKPCRRAPERRAQVEAETVDMHHLDPVAQLSRTMRSTMG
jgi:hypothetical protein